MLPCTRTQTRDSEGSTSALACSAPMTGAVPRVPSVPRKPRPWRATVELRRNANAGLAQRGGRPRVCRNPTEAEVSSLIGGVPETSPRS